MIAVPSDLGETIVRVCGEINGLVVAAIAEGDAAKCKQLVADRQFALLKIVMEVQGNRKDGSPMKWADLRLMMASLLRSSLDLLEKGDGDPLEEVR